MLNNSSSYNTDLTLHSDEKNISSINFDHSLHSQHDFHLMVTTSPCCAQLCSLLFAHAIHSVSTAPDHQRTVRNCTHATAATILLQSHRAN